MHADAHTLLEQAVQSVFKGKLFATPVVVGQTFGWAAQTSYIHVHKNTFPVPLTQVAGKRLVSLASFIQFITGENPVPVQAKKEDVKRGRGRPSKKSLADCKNGGV